MANNSGKKRSLYGFIIFFVCLYAVVSLFIFDSDTYRESIKIELEQSELQLSANEWEGLKSSATDRYQRWYIDSGFQTKLHDALLPADDTKSVVINNLLTEKYNYRFVNNLAYTVFQAAFRIEMLKFWFFLTLPIVVAIIITGYYKWRINLFNMSSGNTMFVRVFLRSILLFMFLLALYVMMPHLRIPYAFYAPPIAIWLTSLAISRVIASFHKDF